MFPFAKKTPVLFSFPHQGPPQIAWPSTMHHRPLGTGVGRWRQVCAPGRQPPAPSHAAATVTVVLVRPIASFHAPRAVRPDSIPHALAGLPPFLALRPVSTAHARRRSGSPAPTAQAPHWDSPRRRASTCVDFRTMVFAMGGTGFSSGSGSGQSGHA
jgi:hypothetical protein